jgi:CrcB protein
MVKLLLIAGGGALGALLRYGLSGWAQRLTDSTFPVGTLLVNVCGCLLIGILGGIFAGPTLVREEHRVALLIGVLGAFTTFSTFGWETFQLANDGELGRASMNIALSNGLGLAAVWIGYRLTERVLGL